MSGDHTSKSNGSSSANPPKDYAAAFASLSSTYGNGGRAPQPTPKSSSKTSSNSSGGYVRLPDDKPAPSPVAAAQTQHQQQQKQSPPAKDYAAAFANLSSKYGFEGQSNLGPKKH